MRTKQTAAVVLVAILAVAQTGCPPTRQGALGRVARAADEVIRWRERSYANLYAGFLAKHATAEDLEKGRALYDEVYGTAMALHGELQLAMAEGDRDLRSPGRRERVNEYLRVLRERMSAMRGMGICGLFPPPILPEV